MSGIGGIAGTINLNDRITTSTNSGNVTTYQANNYGNAATGGIVGRNKGGRIGGGTSATKCTNSGTITNNAGCFAGGIVGMHQIGKIYYAENTGTVKGTGHGISSEGTQNDAKFGGIAGYNYGGYITNCTNSGSVSSNSSAYGLVGGILGYNKGFDNSEDPDIDWAPGDSGAYVFNCTNSGSVAGKNKVGGIVGYNDANGAVGESTGNSINNAQIYKCTVSMSGTGSIKGTDYVGGIAGHNSRGAVFQCTVSGGIITVQGTNYVGGITGSNNDYCGNNTFSGGGHKVLGTSYIGGIAGYNSGYLYDNTNSCSGVTITGTTDTAGIAGYNNKTVKENTLSSSGGTITGTTYTGGIVGINSGSNARVIDCNFTSTTVTIKATAAVTGSNGLGGIAGRNTANSYVQRCVFKGQLKMAGRSGGIVGLNNGIIGEKF